ncbi:Dda-like ATP dependent DNA helicase [Aeromonas phage Gekk3-15]
MGDIELTEITLNGGQGSAVQSLQEWWDAIQKVRQKYGKHAIIADYMRPYFVIAGLAGTGKTTIVKYGVRAIGLHPHKCVFIAPTGKAASRLRAKGNAGAMTLHSFAYLCLGEFEDERTGEDQPVFIERGSLDFVPDLVVLDEGSMVSARDRETLVSFNIPLVVLGDHGQLDPVNAVAGFDLENGSDVKLEEIERQGADSNIIRAAMFVRQGYQLPERDYPDMKVIRGYPSTEKFVEFAGLDGVSQILCGRNETRRSINSEVRAALGFTAPLPKKGEKIVCTFNQRNHGVMNGELYIVDGFPEKPTMEEYRGDDHDVWFIPLVSTDDGRKVRARFNPKCFLAEVDSDEHKEALKHAGGWDWGYAITVHKSQGSEWDNVLLVDESMSGNKAKWRYTGITRAALYLEYWR